MCSVSLWTLTAIIMDRLLARLLGLRPKQVVTLKRAHVNESCSQQMVLYDSYITVSSKHGLLLNVQYSSHPPSSKSSTRPCSTKEPKKSTEHSVIQKGSVHCNMTAIDGSRWLSTLWCSCACVD